MTKYKLVPLGALACALSLAVAPTALAEEAGSSTAIEVSKGDMLYSSDGHRIDNVYRVTEDGDLQLIVDAQMITIDASTLSIVDGKLTTSLTEDELENL